MARSDAGLFDLQVNGYAGVDFNDPSITADALDHALERMLASGVTGCLPTLITAHPHELQERFEALDRAVATSRLGPQMVPGFHLEGPFFNPQPGYAGCHPSAAMIDPDARLVERLGKTLSRPILLVTLAPERAGAFEAIRELKALGITIAMAHSSAGFEAVRAAADAGLSLSTHLGNGLPPLLPKVENTLLAQLTEARLGACLIADGHHLSPQALQALIAIKGVGKTILVTDAVLAAAAPPGMYRFAGMQIELSDDGVVRVPGQTNLAGSSLTLDRAVRNVVAWGITSPRDAIEMASGNARRALAQTARYYGIQLPTGSVVWDEMLNPMRVTI
jgi:N-acetylglucosamine-6-phosphate deacetylase